MRTFNKKSTKEKRLRLRQNMTHTESLLWERIKSRRFLNLKFRRQHGIGEYIVDFYCAEKKLVIELDGNQHYSNDGLEYDAERTKFFDSLGVSVIRFRNEDIICDINMCLERIKSFSSPYQGEDVR